MHVAAGTLQRATGTSATYWRALVDQLRRRTVARTCEAIPGAPDAHGTPVRRAGRQPRSREPGAVRQAGVRRAQKREDCMPSDALRVGRAKHACGCDAGETRPAANQDAEPAIAKSRRVAMRFASRGRARAANWRAAGNCA